MGLKRMALLVVLISSTARGESSWTDRLSFGGDLRFQHDYTSKSRATDHSDSHKERLRLRFGFQAKVNDEIATRVRLATSDGSSPTGTNSTLTNNAEKKGVFIDIASMSWSLNPSLNLHLGKMENPFRILHQSQLVFDSDYTPEGAAFAIEKDRYFIKIGGFVIQERSPKANGENNPDAWLLSSLAGFESDISEAMSIRVAAAYHGFTSLKHHLALAPGSSSGNFYGNTHYASPDGPKYLNDYHVGELLAELRLDQSERRLIFYLDAINNFATGEFNKAFLAGTLLHILDDDRTPMWTFGYAYQHIDEDATVSAINNSYFGNGVDGSFGHIGQLSRRLAKNTDLSFSWYHVHIRNSGNPFSTNKGLLELLIRF